MLQNKPAFQLLNPLLSTQSVGDAVVGVGGAAWLHQSLVLDPGCCLAGGWSSAESQSRESVGCCSLLAAFQRFFLTLGIGKASSCFKFCFHERDILPSFPSEEIQLSSFPLLLAWRECCRGSQSALGRKRSFKVIWSNTHAVSRGLFQPW